MSLNDQSGITGGFNTMINCLPIFIRGLGRDHNLKTCIGGNGAYLNWETNTVHFPTLPMDDPDVEVLAFGYGVHEIGHKLFTDPSQKGGITTELHRGLYQAIEDCREEILMGRTHPGSKIRLARLAKKMVVDGGFGVPQPTDHPARIMECYVLNRLRYEGIGQEALREIAEESERIFREVVPSGIVTRTNAILGGFRDLNCTADSVELAAKLIQALEEPQEDDPEESSDNSGSSDDNEQTQQPETPTADGMPADAPPEEAAQPSEPGSDPSTNSNSSNTATVGDPAEETIQKILDATADDLLGDYGDTVGECLAAEAQEAVSKEGGGAGVGYATSSPPPVDDPTLFLDHTRAATNACQTTLRAKLESRRKARITRRRNGKRLDTKALTNEQPGFDKLFKHRSFKDGLNTDVIILTDASGSMNDEQIEVAMKSALAVGLALDDLQGVRFASATFPGYGSPVSELTGMQETAKQTANRYPSVKSGGGTPLADALLWAYDRLFEQKGHRKVIFILTDGEPAHVKLVSNLIHRGSEARVEIYGVGIMTDFGRGLFPNWEVIHSINDLPPTLFRMIDGAVGNAA